MSQWGEDGVRRSRRKIERDAPTPAQLGDALMSLPEVNSLEFVSSDIVHNEAVEKTLTMIDEGGKNLLLADKREYFPSLSNNSNESFSLLTMLIISETPDEILYKMIEVGGKELVLRRFLNNNYTSLMVALKSDTGLDLISKLIEIGGKELVMAAANGGNTILHYFSRCSESLEILKLIIDVGGRDILNKKNDDGFLPVTVSVAELGPGEDEIRRKIHEILIVLIKEGIHHDIGDEFSMGGLLQGLHIQRSDVRFQGYWEYHLFPVSMEVYRLINNESPSETLPLLHSMIKFNAPKFIIVDTLYRLEGLASIKDTKGRDALDFAIEMNLPFDQGMREILEFTAKANDLNILHCAAQHGLPWKSGMKRLVEVNLNYALYGINEKIGLKLFMTAAVGGNLDTFYSLIRMDPMSIFYA